MSQTVTLLTGGRVVGPDDVWEDRDVVVEGGQIAEIRGRGGRRPSVDRVISLEGAYLTPGLIDLHIHGGGGADFMDGSVAAVQTVCRTHLRHGTTTLFPTTTTGTPQQLQAMLAACREVQAAEVAQAQHAKPPRATITAANAAVDDSRNDKVPQARIGGVHLYGPYFAPDKVGCHLPQHRREPLVEEYRPYFATGIVKIATCAAELPGAAAFYRYAKKQGCLVTCGHSNSTYAEMQAAFRAGMRHVDHFWCAMSSVTSLRGRCGVPMQASMEQFVLMEPEMSTELIADGCHLSDDLLRFAWRFKGADRLCLVTDASRALDQPPGEYRFGSDDDGPLFRSDGQVGWTLDGRGLASSVGGMDRMVRTMYRATGGPLPEVIRMASLTPAERVGIAHEVGSIAIGKRADLVVWSPRLQVKAVMLDGRLHKIKK